MILRTIDLVKDFGSLRAVDNVSLDIEGGEVRAIIGPNGAGKSTLLDLITNRSHPTSGSVYFRGKEITNLPPFTIASKGIGRCFQISKLFLGLTTFENVQIACISKWGKVYHMYSFKNNVLDHEVTKVLDSIGLNEMADELAGYLSYGDQRRLEIGITLAMMPTLLLLDEPTAGVSRGEGNDLMRLIKKLAAEQALTIIFIEHDMDMVFNYADKISVMHQGRVIATGIPDEIRNNSLVQNIYLGEKIS
ncbi:MAG: ABC transporter ATP-binding protein [Thermodesulfobacteriota bacterium]|jgi:branched-chain amino acid transport system ATP-binding protein